MPERTIAVRVDEELFQNVKARLLQKKQTMKEYIVELIENDLQNGEDAFSHNVYSITISMKELEQYIKTHELKSTKKEFSFDGKKKE